MILIEAGWICDREKVLGLGSIGWVDVMSEIVSIQHFFGLEYHVQ